MDARPNRLQTMPGLSCSLGVAAGISYLPGVSAGLQSSFLA